jgi:alanine-glyoxylate transaminase / (R)-3-amino-2-methylpropionate-pyruvate transaminase
MSTTSSSHPLSLPDTDHKPARYEGPSREAVIALRTQYVSPGVISYYAEPLMLVEGHMQYVWDETGRRYLDAFAGVVTISVGHCHPHVAARVQEQAGKLQHTTTLYWHPAIGQLAGKLAEKLPDGLSCTYFTNSGSEANEAAVLVAREFTGNTPAVALRGCYHGGTTAVMGLTAQGTWKFPSNPAVNVHHTHAGYCYRCPFGLTYPSCELKCARDVQNVIDYETSGQVACFIGEPIQGVGGVVTPPPEFFQIVYDIVRSRGGLCIADEVQGGFGRTGRHYWSHENWGVVPDIVTMAKGLANGAPVGAMSASREVSEMLARRIHFNTFGGNPVSMTAGLATLEVIDAEELQRNALEVGGRLKEGLLGLQERHGLIGEVRGLGLMLGVELVRDRQTKEPAKEETARVLELARERGLLLGKGGLYGNTLRIKPPLCITQDDAAFIVSCLDEALGLVEESRSN